MRKIVIFLLIVTHSYSNKGWKGNCCDFSNVSAQNQNPLDPQDFGLPGSNISKNKKIISKKLLRSNPKSELRKKEIIKIFWFIKNSTVLAYNLATNLKILLCKKMDPDPSFSIVRIQDPDQN